MSGGAGGGPGGPPSLPSPGPGPTRGSPEGWRGRPGLRGRRGDTPGPGPVRVPGPRLPRPAAGASHLPDSWFASGQGYAARGRRPALIAGLAPLGGAPGTRAPRAGASRRGVLEPSGGPPRPGDGKHFASGKPAGYFKTSGVSGQCSLAAEVGSNYCITHILPFRDKSRGSSFIFLL